MVLDWGLFWLGMLQRSIDKCTIWGCKAYGLGHKAGRERAKAGKGGTARLLVGGWRSAHVRLADFLFRLEAKGR